MIRDKEHPLVGRIVRATFAEHGTFTGIVREVDAPHERLRSLVVQRPGREGSTPSSTCCGETIRVPASPSSNLCGACLTGKAVSS